VKGSLRIRKMEENITKELLLFSDKISFIHDKNVTHYCKEAPFDPPAAYPELPFVKKINKENSVYPMVRNLLWKIGLDAENFKTENWNPFKEIIKPGDKVLIKPNLVTHIHYLGQESLYGSITHGSFIRPIIDYVHLAQKGNGSIVVADNPVEHTDFESIMRFTGIKRMVEELYSKGYDGLEVVDLRPKVLKEAKNGEFYYDSQIGDPLGYVEIDLGGDSLFAEFDNKPNIHYFTLADKTVDHVDPKFKGKSATDDFHNSNSHKYIVSKSILDADVIINIAKMKTHCKAGVSLTLKNMIGMVYEKNCMPHHRPGIPPDGDACPFYPASHYIASRKLYIKVLRKWLQIHRFPGFRAFRNFLQRNRILIGKHIEHGNWKGNDTIWRTILDLNRIAIYADKNGAMCEFPQRKYFAIIDGIVGQQGEGPMNGNPVVASTLIGGFNPVMVDALAIMKMGIRLDLIKSITEAIKIDKYKLYKNEDHFPKTSTLEHGGLNFDVPLGWRQFKN